LFAGLGVWYAVQGLSAAQNRRALWLLAGALLGFALGTKYTGLQVVFAVGLVLVIGLVLQKEIKTAWKPLAMALVLCGALACPWYVKNAAWTGNPVYPFFYSKLGGKSWDTWRAAIYQDEQQTFGVGRTDTGRDPIQIGHAILGTAYQPGRYVNPGQTEGRGFPTGAVGFAALLASIWWCASGRAKTNEKGVLATQFVMLLMWFFLSQQSRYLTGMVAAFSVLAGGAIANLVWGRVMAVAPSKLLTLVG